MGGCTTQRHCNFIFNTTRPCHVNPIPNYPRILEIELYASSNWIKRPVACSTLVIPRVETLRVSKAFCGKAINPPHNPPNLDGLDFLSGFTASVTAVMLPSYTLSSTGEARPAYHQKQFLHLRGKSVVALKRQIRT
jgi:hypothetical protein